MIVWPKARRWFVDQLEVKAVAADRKDAMADAHAFRRHIRRTVAIDIDHRNAARLEQGCEEPQLRVEIGLDGWVIVEVIPAKIRECSRLQWHRIEPALVEANATTLPWRGG